jgi:hypothetical protein
LIGPSDQTLLTLSLLFSLSRVAFLELILSGVISRRNSAAFFRISNGDSSGMLQCSLDVGRMMVDGVEALSDVLVVSTVCLAVAMHI